jgi:hypothetical protein
MDERSVTLNEREASLALHALRFYINAKGNEISSNTTKLETKLDRFLDGTEFVVTNVETVASIFASRGGIKGGASTSDAKRAAAAANGAKGGRPKNPNLFIRFSKSVWHEPDLKLLDELETLTGTTSWLPQERGDERQGPYVRIHVEQVTERIKKLLSNSLNVFEWDERGVYRFCMKHANNQSKELPASEKGQITCHAEGCGEPSMWMY